MRKTSISSMQQANAITLLVGVVFILISIIVGVEKTFAVILLSIGTSILASALVSFLNSRFLLQQNKAQELVEQWGIDQIYKTRAESNNETNKLLKHTKKLEICAMGLSNFRDAQDKEIQRKISEGMILRILTLDPNSEFLSMIDATEGNMVGSTKASILSLIKWISELQKIQLFDKQIEIKTYDHYPYDYFFIMDGIVFTGPYQNKQSQQTITYKYAANTLGAEVYIDYFRTLWKNTI